MTPGPLQIEQMAAQIKELLVTVNALKQRVDELSPRKP